MVERLVANEKVEGSTPFARSKIFNVIKSKFITSIFQSFLKKKDIRFYKNKIFYYLLFRTVRPFLAEDLVINIFNFRIFGSIEKNKTSYYLLKKCEFGDDDELKLIEQFSKKKKILFIDCGCNYGFYSFFAAIQSRDNIVVSIDASKNTLLEFDKNLNLNSFENIIYLNKAVSDEDNKDVKFNESDKDWESSLSHDEFKVSFSRDVKTIKIDTLVEEYNLNNYQTIIKLDVEGSEMKALKGGINTIKKFSPIIIIEMSKFIFNNNKNIIFFKNFLKENDYLIYDTSKNRSNLNDVLKKLDQLTKRHKTIGNYFLIKNNEKLIAKLRNND